MNTIKTILRYRNQTPGEVLFHQKARRVNDKIAFTRHMIKYIMIQQGISSMTIQRHMTAISSGFNHASVLHSVRTVEAQPCIFAKMIDDLNKLMAN